MTPPAPAPLSADVEKVVTYLENLARAKWDSDVYDHHETSEWKAAQLLRALAAQVAGLEAAVDHAAVWFEDYAQMHLTKGAHDKSARNQERASFLRAALAPRTEKTP
jgi:hypothetical protein